VKDDDVVEEISQEVDSGGEMMREQSVIFKVE